MAQISRNNAPSLRKGDKIPVFKINSPGNYSATSLTQNLIKDSQPTDGYQKIEYKAARCPSNRNTQTLVNWKLFYEKTKIPGKETYTKGA